MTLKENRWIVEFQILRQEHNVRFAGHQSIEFDGDLNVLLCLRNLHHDELLGFPVRLRCCCRGSSAVGPRLTVGWNLCFGTGRNWGLYDDNNDRANYPPDCSLAPHIGRVPPRFNLNINRGSNFEPPKRAGCVSHRPNNDWLFGSPGPGPRTRSTPCPPAHL